MPDVFDKAKRSQVMAAIRGRGSAALSQLKLGWHTGARSVSEGILTG